MRNPARLEPLYQQMAEAHRDHFADMRIGQLFLNFSAYFYEKYGRDFFYIEDEEFVEEFKEYLNKIGY